MGFGGGFLCLFVGALMFHFFGFCLFLVGEGEDGGFVLNIRLLDAFVVALVNPKSDLLT